MASDTQIRPTHQVVNRRSEAFTLRATYRQKDIQDRTFSFAARILKMVRSLPKDAVGQIVARQVARCGTSVGANVEEAQGAQSRSDFARRMNIALSESRETWYWLRLLAETRLVPPSRLSAIIQEAEELVRILTTIVKKSRSSVNEGVR